MKKAVYKFLDTYLGMGYQTNNTVPLYDPFTFQPCISVLFNSDAGIYILRLIINDSGIVIRVNSLLIETVIKFIPIDEVDCHSYIINWFCDRNNIKKEDLIMNYKKENEKLFNTPSSI